MKYKIIGKKIKSEYNDVGISDAGDWVDKLDGEIIDESDFLFGGEIGFYKDKLIRKDWCEPIEESSKINTDKLIEKITEFCKHKIKIIDEMEDTIVTDSDIGRAYAYHKILDIIEREVNTND